jgi:hypothetical protein
MIPRQAGVNLTAEERAQTGEGNFRANFANERKWGAEGSLAAKRQEAEKEQNFFMMLSKCAGWLY